VTGAPRLRIRSQYRAGRVERLDLKPLGESGTRALGDHLLGAPLDDEAATRLFEQTEGNPLFVVEYLAAGLEGLMDDTLPGSVQAVIEGRLAQLPEPADEIMRLLAASGRETSWEVLTDACDASAGSVADALDVLWRRGLVREQGGEAYAISHGRIGEVVRSVSGFARRRLAHQRLAAALERRADPERHAVEIAAHHEAAGAPAEALRWYRTSAERSERRFSNEDALASLDRAMALGGALDDEARRQLLELRGDVQSRVGRSEEAAASFEQALSVASLDAETRARLLRKQAHAHQKRQQHADALECCARAEAALGEAFQQGEGSLAREAIEIDLARLMSHYWRADPDAMATVAERVRPRVDRHGAPEQQAQFYLLMLTLEQRRHRYALTPEIRAFVEAHRSAARASGSDSADGEASFMEGFAWLGGGVLDRAQRPLDEALTLARRMGDRWLELRCVTYRALLERRRRAPDALSSWNGEVDRLAKQLGLASYQAVAISNDAWVRWVQESPTPQLVTHVIEATERARALWSASPMVYPFQWVGLWPRLDALLARGGDPSDAMRTCAGELLSPEQQWIPEDLEHLLRAVVDGDAQAAAAACEGARTLGLL
jgi:tetratricopeptide (TPR) repeat protein